MVEGSMVCTPQRVAGAAQYFPTECKGGSAS
jgi:hypothetical protein